MGQMCTTTRDLSIAQSFTSIIVIYIDRKVHGRTCTFLSLFPSIVSLLVVVAAITSHDTTKIVEVATPDTI